VTGLEAALLVSGMARVAIWAVGVTVCVQIGSRVGVVAFGAFTILASLNTLRDAGLVDHAGTVARTAQIGATPAAAIMVATLILNHRTKV